MRKSYSQLARERRRKWSKNANAARERKRIAQAADAREVGAVLLLGPAFGGSHTIRLLDAGDGEHLFLEADGRACRPRTARGIRALIARLIHKANSGGHANGNHA